MERHMRGAYVEAARASIFPTTTASKPGGRKFLTTLQAERLQVAAEDPDGQVFISSVSCAQQMHRDGLVTKCGSSWRGIYKITAKGLAAINRERKPAAGGSAPTLDAANTPGAKEQSHGG
jgi:hypothetical protein